MGPLQNEWAIIHSDIENYERYSLVIKLFAVLTSLASMACSIGMIFSVSLTLILWIQDGIWKTFQQRLGARITIIEKNLQHKNTGDNLAFQLYSQWEGQRQGAVGLIKEYLSNAAKPTVAYPYALLVVLALVFYW